nr:3641_t:CDS:10 [Entrophospora candida]
MRELVLVRKLEGEKRKTNHDNEKEAILSSKSEEERSILRTKRESLKEFFLQKQPYNINKDKSKGEHETLKLNNNNIKIFASTVQTEIKEEIVNDISADESGVSSIETITTTKIVISDSSNELSPDEKRQRAAATRSKQNMELKNLMKQKKREQNLDNNDETIMFVPKNLIDSLNEQKKKSVNTTAADVESDGSVDLDDLIGQISDLESGTILRNLTPSTTPLATPLRGPSPNSQISSSTYNLTRPTSTIAEEDENLSDTPLEVDKQEADDLWKTSNTNKEFDMESKEEDELDLLLDTEIMPILKPSSPSPVPTPNSSLSGGKMGIPPGLSKSAFYSLSYARSPLSPNSSQASSVVDPEEFETLSNGSHTSTSSRSISASGIRRPSNTTGIRSPTRNDRSPSKIARSGALSPRYPRSLSRASNSSAEESTTSSIGGAISPTRIASPTRGYHLSMYNTPTSFRQRSISGVSSSSADEILSRPQTSPPTYRSLSRIGGNIGGNKSSTSTDSPKQIRSSLPPPSSSTKNNAKTSKTGSKRPTSQPVSSNITSSGLLSPSSRAGITNSRNNNVPANDSHDEHSGSSMIFSPPDSPVGSSETESLTSTMSYGSSAGRVASPSQVYNNSNNFSMLPSPTNFSDKKSATITVAPTVIAYSQISEIIEGIFEAAINSIDSDEDANNNNMTEDPFNLDLDTKLEAMPKKKKQRLSGFIKKENKRLETIEESPVLIEKVNTIDDFDRPSSSLQSSTEHSPISLDSTSSFLPSTSSSSFSSLIINDYPTITTTNSITLFDISNPLQIVEYGGIRPGSSSPLPPPSSLSPLASFDNFDTLVEIKKSYPPNNHDEAIKSDSLSNNEDGTSVDQDDNGDFKRRRTQVNYAEPNLRKKLRRGDPQTNSFGLTNSDLEKMSKKNSRKSFSNR